MFGACNVLTECTSVLAECTTDVRQWYLQNGLQLNPDKSEALIVGTNNQLHAVTSSVSSVSVASASRFDLPVAEEMKLLGVVHQRCRAVASLPTLTTASSFYRRDSAPPGR